MDQASLMHGALDAFDLEATVTVSVAAEPARVFAALSAFDPKSDPALRAVFVLHDAPARLRAAGAAGARSLSRPGPLGRWAMAARPPRGRVPGELLLGFVGRFWWPFAPVTMPALEKFRARRFDDATQVIWAFAVRPNGAHASRLSCTLRAHSSTRRARLAFGAYWKLVARPSNAVRARLLRKIKLAAEAGTQPTQGAEAQG